MVSASHSRWVERAPESLESVPHSALLLAEIASQPLGLLPNLSCTRCTGLTLNGEAIHAD